MEHANEALEWLCERAEKKSEYELDLANVLDVKGGILLAIIALLASDPLRVFVGVPGGVTAKALEIIFAILLFGAATFAVCELWPRVYRSDPLPSENFEWIGKLGEHFKKYPAEGLASEHAVRDQVSTAMFQKFSDRASLNARLNQSKITCLSWSFRFAVYSMAVYVISGLSLKGL